MSRLKIGKAVLAYDGSTEVFGQTCSGVASRGHRKSWHLVGIPGVSMTVADTVWDSGERDVGCTHAEAPVQLMRLLQGLRLCLQSTEDRHYGELKIARINLGTPRLWSSLYKSSLTDLAAGAGGIDPVDVLLDNGAIDVGLRSSVVNDRGRNRGFLAFVFTDDVSQAPLAAYTLTRLLPLLNVYSSIHRHREAIARMRRLYVVELDDDAGPRRTADLPNVYVGETGRSPEDRLATHRAGGMTASRTVTRYGIGLRPDLYEHIPPEPDEPASSAAERRLRADLEALGYTVHGGTRGIGEAPFAQG